MDKNIVLIGMPGCGKTTLGKMLADHIDYNFIDIDDMIVRNYDTIENLFAQNEDVFREKESLCAINASTMYKTIIATGGGIVLRKENMIALSKNGIIVFIDRPLDDILNDIAIGTRPLLKDGKNKLVTLHHARIGLYNKYADIIISGDKPLVNVLDALMNAIKEKL